MLGKLKEFEYFEPTTLTEVISLLNQYGEAAKVLAGGTDLLVNMKERTQSPQYVINIKNIDNTRYIDYDEKEGLKLGALTTIRQIETARVVQEQFPVLAQAAKSLGSVQVRNLATIGGNLCNASPSADTAPPLLVLNSAVKVVGAQGERVVPLQEFFTGPGSTVLDREILTEIRVPPPSPESRGVYLSISRRRAVDLALVGVAAVASGMGDPGEWAEVAIALGAVAPTPVRAYEAEKFLKGKKIEPSSIEEASRIASEEARPISDVRASAWYRKELVTVLVQRALEHVSETT